jgi:hypothetical protein
MRSNRTQAGRDAVTVEMVFAAATGAVLAAIGFLALTSPVMAGAAHGTAREGWITAAVIVAAAIFCGRVAVTLRRYERAGRAAQVEGEDASGLGQLPSPSGLPEPSGLQVDGDAPDPAAGPWVPRQRDASSGGPGGATSSDQPSQPGRTSPDS